ncbi:MAG: excinuclease ABC subunit UvrC [Treponema sp.]|nr:excinuclease ABC subunit UvrC [Treponema sp.]
MTTKTTRDILHETALKAPLSSGVYLWKNTEGTVIYVGKAKNLKNRLTSYFSGKKDIKTRLLISHASSIEYITTTNEYEALLLENNLIKKYSPRYNINLKDGKSYPVLRITKEDYPKLFKTRRILQDGSTYFGPYPDVNALDTFLETIFKLYPVRHCRTFRKRETPCLYYHIKQCMAPCCNRISKESYNQFIGEIINLLEGKEESTINALTQKMKQAGKELNFEKAALLRDGIKALMILQNQNVVESFDSEDRDYIAWYSEGELISFTVLKIRQGKLLGRENFRVESLNDEDDLTGEFMACYYEDENQIPPGIYITKTSEYNNISTWLKQTFPKASSRLIMIEGNNGDRPRDKAAMNMAVQNAKEDIIRRLRDRGDSPAMEELKSLLNLDCLPVRIEGFDIAHIGGKFPVASLVSFYNGNPDKKNYRYLRLKTTDGMIDDFASMREAVSRRYTRLLNEQADLPDLILIDGGIGQVNAAEGILHALNLDIPLIGLAEKKEDIYLPGNSTPISLPRRSDALRLLQRVRDETHRFATSRNQNLRTKENTDSIFLKIHEIGEKRAAELQKKFITLENLSQAEESAVAQCLHIPARDAAQILLSAKKLYQEQEETKNLQKLALHTAGTTKEKSAGSQYLDNLAEQALLAASKHD